MQHSSCWRRCYALCSAANASWLKVRKRMARCSAGVHTGLMAWATRRVRVVHGGARDDEDVVDEERALDEPERPC